MNSTSRGRMGEDFACRYLERCGYTIVSRNYRAPHGELDIVAADERYIAFVEVKARKVAPYRSKYGRPATAVTPAKKAHIISAIKQYLRDNPSPLKPRIDVIEVYTGENPAGEVLMLEIKHYKNAFGADTASDEA